MPAGSTLVPCRAGTRELATVARDVHAARNPQHHTVDTQASAEVGWFYEGGGRTWAMAGASMFMHEEHGAEDGEQRGGDTGHGGKG